MYRIGHTCTSVVYLDGLGYNERLSGIVISVRIFNNTGGRKLTSVSVNAINVFACGCAWSVFGRFFFSFLPVELSRMVSTITTKDATR